MDYDRADYDNVAWDKSDEDWGETAIDFRRHDTCRSVEAMVKTQLGGDAVLVPPIIFGGYNVLYHTTVEGYSYDVVIRRPISSTAKFAAEKTVREVATARFIQQNTKLPVPRHICCEQDSSIGPFVIMEFVANKETMSFVLHNPDDHPDDSFTLNPNILEPVLEDMYAQMASYYLQLFQHSFRRIGSLGEAHDGSFHVVARPITQNMNNMLQLANIPRAVLPDPDKTYGSADEWYVALAEMHLIQLIFQHNDLVKTADDARNKYVARQLFRRLARQGKLSTFGFAEDDWSAQSRKTSHLSSAPSATGEFRLWCDDLRATNALLDDTDHIVAMVDWEFAYAAPTQFALDPPWWLLLDVPEMWWPNMEAWREIYEKRLETWLSAMRRAEQDTPGTPTPPLSARMRESWDTGRFWLNYAARKSWAFDSMFWNHLDERFFGEQDVAVPKNELWKTRLHLLTEEERNAMELFVERKLEDAKERILIDWDPEEAKKRLAELLFD